MISKPTHNAGLPKLALLRCAESGNRRGPKGPASADADAIKWRGQGWLKFSRRMCNVWRRKRPRTPATWRIPQRQAYTEHLRAPRTNAPNRRLALGGPRPLIAAGAGARETQKASRQSPTQLRARSTWPERRNAKHRCSGGAIRRRARIGPETIPIHPDEHRRKLGRPPSPDCSASRRSRALLRCAAQATRRSTYLPRRKGRRRNAALGRGPFPRFNGDLGRPRDGRSMLRKSKV